MAKRAYSIKLTALGPVHIGDGSTIGKKDYFVNKDGIAVLDASKFVAGLSSEQVDRYCDFLESDSRVGLVDFIGNNPDLRSAANNAIKYSVSGRLRKTQRGTYQYHEVAAFVKDAHGCPYVPGSSLKGMLRTAILISLVDSSKRDCLTRYDREKARGRERKTACKGLEKATLWKEKPDKSDSSVLNDVMRYVAVSDSKPLDASNLTFVKKYDLFSKADDGCHKCDMGNSSNWKTDYRGNEIGVYRECIKPGTVVEFTMTIDEEIDKYIYSPILNDQGILEILDSAYQLYQNRYLSHFEYDSPTSAILNEDRCGYILQEGPLKGERCRNHAVNGTGFCHTHQDKASASSSSSEDSAIWYLGGGVDYNSKTVSMALFENESDWLTEVSHILYEQFPSKVDSKLYPSLKKDIAEAGFSVRSMKAIYKNGQLKKAKDDHRHWRDAEFGVTPHTMKLGIVEGKKLPMGRCRITIEELNSYDFG